MPYFWPSRGLQVRGLIKTSREPTELNTHSIRYEPWNMRPQASSMQDRCAKTLIILGERSTSRVQKEDGNFNVR